MSMSVPNVSKPTVQATTADPNKPTETPNNVQTQSSSAVPSQNGNELPQGKYAFAKECRDWINSGLLGLTLAVGLVMTFLAVSRTNFKEVNKALSENDVNLKEVLKALGENNKNTAKIIEENNGHTKKTIEENTQYLKEVIKVLDKDGDGKLSEAEVKEARTLMEEARNWKVFTDAIRSETTKKK